VVSERERLNEDLQKIVDEQTEPWGIKVSISRDQDVEIPELHDRVPPPLDLLEPFLRRAAPDAAAIEHNGRPATP